MEYFHIICFGICIISKIICFKFVSETNLKICVQMINQKANGPCFCDTVTPFACSCLLHGKRYVTSAVSALIFAEKREKAQKWPPSEPYDASIWHPLLGILTGNEEPLKHLQKYPQTLPHINTNFYLFDDFSSILIDYKRLDTLKSLRQYDLLYLVIHGYFGSIESFLHMKDKLVDRKVNSAVVLVDWSVSSHALYSTAAANTVIVGREVGLLLYLLVKQSRVSAKNVHVIGHNLGAQMAHFAGQWFQQLIVTDVMKERKRQCNPLPVIRLNRITGLDPSSTDFEGYQGSHVRRDDAFFVDVIHTSSVSIEASPEDILLGFSGMSQAVGDIDFYPNGGKSQPGCQSFIGSDVINGLCSESKAVIYFEESLKEENRHLLKSFPCNAWSDFNDCKRKKENPRLFSRMGMDASHFCGKGKHYLSYKSAEFIGEEKHSLQLNAKKFEIDSISLEPKGWIPTPSSLSDYFWSLMTDCFGYDPNFVPFLQTPPNNRTADIPVYPDPIEEPPKVAVFPRNKGSGIMFNHPSCGLSRDPSGGGKRGRIFNGFDAYSGQFPWTVFIRSVDRRTGSDTSCTGSIINKYWILTAAHCIKAKSEWKYTDVDIIYGRTRLFVSKPGHTIVQQHDRGHTFVHPLYFSCSVVDIALIKLKEYHAIQGLPKGREKYRGGPVNRICLRSMDVSGIGNKMPLTVSGFGQVGTDSDGLEIDADRLKYAVLRLVPESMCSIFRTSDIAQEHNFCFASNNKNTTICHGDSGAPIVVKRKVDGRMEKNVNTFRFHQTAVNVAATNMPCGNISHVFHNKRYPVVSYGLKIKSVIEWIYQTIKDNSDETISSDM